MAASLDRGPAFLAKRFPGKYEGPNMPDNSIPTTFEELSERLSELHGQTRSTPQFNPVFQLALDISRSLESGNTNLEQLSSLVDELEAQSLDARADRLSSLLAPKEADERLGALCRQDRTFEEFCSFWGQPHMHAVFTAHPTFLLTPSQGEAVAKAVVDDAVAADVQETERPEITLPFEHDQAMTALVHAQDARDQIVAAVLSEAQSKWPDKWLDCQPFPFRFATWVGYDMDGRTDIKWYNSIAFRLSEKLSNYTT